MKTKIAIITLLAGSIFLLPLCVKAQATPNQDAFIAVVAKAIQPVQLLRGANQKPVPLQKDTRLYPGDQILCGENGYASLIFADNAVEQKLYPNTTLTLQGERKDKDITKRVLLTLGRLLSQVMRGDMEVVTPTSVASVKGTKWWTLVDESTQSEVIVLEGNVRVQHRATGVIQVVAAGNTAVATPAGGLQSNPSIENEIPSESQNQGQGSLEIEFQDESGATKTLHIDFER